MRRDNSSTNPAPRTAQTMAGDRRSSWVIRFSAVQRLVTALGVGLATFLMQPNWIPAHTRVLVSWNLGALVYLGLAWALITRADARITRERTLNQDQSGYLIFLLVVSAACASLVAIGFVASTMKELTFWPKVWHLALSATALLSSWLLIHTVFALHYARRYYAVWRHGSPETPDLLFPGTREPDYLDLAYYSFVVGMTSQVSDVAVTSRRMRRLTLTHSILSFIFNITVLALSINIIASALY